MVSRTTDDYKRMALAGCVMVSEPAFWAGFDRSGPEGFRDYFRQLVDFERKRAALYGIEHQAWLCINAKEAENVGLSREVIAMIPEFLDRPGVLGIGEIGLNKNTKNEATVFLEHVELAAKHRRADPGPYAPPGRQVPGDPDDPRHARGATRRIKPRAGLHRPCRGAHHPPRARGRALGRHDALPDHEVHPRPGGGHDRAVRDRADPRQLRRRLGPQRPPRRARVHLRDAFPRATTRRPSAKSSSTTRSPSSASAGGSRSRPRSAEGKVS